jgi:hypothetical protein
MAGVRVQQYDRAKLEHRGRRGSTGVRATRWLISGLVGLLFATGAIAQEMRIQFAEKVAIAAAPGHTEFDAYGRRFSLDLRANDRLLHELNRTGKLNIDAGRVLRGELRGAPGSWVRLARVGAALEGAIWDGFELYVVTSKSRIEANLTLPIEGAPSQTVVFRLSDSVGGLPKDFCGVDIGLPASEVASRTGLDQYKSMVAELRAHAPSLAADEQLDISLIADSAFQSGSTPSFVRDRMVARVNTVDGIFSGQVGVTIVPSELRLVPAGNDPFTSSDPEVLLDQLANYRNNTPEVKAAGLAHLMTGKGLNGNTVGIAFLDSLCEPREGVSLGNSELGDIFSAFVMAHELGHNFGAPHDGVPGACSSTPQNFLMAPQLNGSGTFSACSVSRMQDPIARARGVCIAGLHYADLALDFPPPGFSFPAQQEFGFPMTIRSIGNEPARNAVLRIELPSEITYQSAVLANGSCAANGSVVTCQIGDVPAGESRTVELRLISSIVGTYFMTGSVAADNDYTQSNNARNMFIGLTSAVDLTVALSASATQVFTSDTIDFTADVTSTRTQAAQGGVLVLNVNGVTIESFSAVAHTCEIPSGQANVVRCNLADVPAGMTTRITVRGRAANPGLFISYANVSVQNDGDFNNNSANVQYSVRSEREVVTTVSTENLNAVIGSPYDVVFTLTSVGRLAATDVSMDVNNPAQGVESVVPSAGTCTTPGPGMEYTCDFGTLNPGDVRTVTVRVRFNSASSLALVGFTRYTNGATPMFTSKITWIYVNLRIDVQAFLGWMHTPVEGQPGSGMFEIQSIGIDRAQNVVATLDVPAPVRLTGLQTTYNPYGFQCTVLTPQRAQCSGSFGVVGQEAALTRVSFGFESDTAISSTAQLTLTADGDGNAANDTSTAAINVNPYIDVGISLDSNPGVVVMNVGELTSLNLTLTVGRNAVSNVNIHASGLSPWYRVESMSLNGSDCPRSGTDQSEFGQYLCATGPVPANAVYPLVVRYRAMQGGVGQGGVPISTSTLNDSNSINNIVFFNARTQQTTDVRVEVAQTTATTTRGSRMRFPLVTVTNSGAPADDIVVNIPLPTFATVDSVSTSGFCTGVTTLQCAFDAIAAGASATIDIQLLTSAEGTFTSNVTMVAGNDSTPANNSASVEVTVTAAPPPPPPPPPPNGGSSSSSGGGKKGGGSLEWLALAFLGLLVSGQTYRTWRELSIARAWKGQVR